MDFIEDVCPECKGRKMLPKLDIKSATTKMAPCPKCFGRGTIQIKPTDYTGMSIMNQIAQIYWFNDNINGNVVSSLLAFMCPMMEDGKPAMRVVGGTSMYRIFMQIIRMNTKSKHRREGRMSKLLEKALQDPKIEYAESSWDQSTADGRNFLLGRGFVQEGNNLVWRRAEKEIKT